MKRRRYMILAMAAIVMLLFLAIWLMLPGRLTQSHIAVGFTTASGHFPEPGRVFADEIVVIWVTNTGRCTITLDEPHVLLHCPDGREIIDSGSSWNQEHYGMDLVPGAAAWLTAGFDRHDSPSVEKLKFVFDYHRDPGPLMRTINQVACFLRLGKAGAAFRRHYESPWFDNPRNGAKRGQGQPAGPVTNRTSTAAVPSRSP
jgi:hypothetical protein